MGTQEEYTARVRAAIGGQRAPASEHGGRRLLYRCPQCGRAWYAEGPIAHLDMTGERLDALAAELGADLGRLPYATCRICDATQGIGELNIDEYAPGRAYGLSFEGVEPAGAHLLLSCLSLAWGEQLRTRGRRPHAGIVTDYAQARAWLAWVRTMPAPLEYAPITPEGSAEMAQTNRPGHGAPGTEGWQWRGALWRAKCPPLGGAVVINLAQGMPPAPEPFSLGLCVELARLLAGIMLAGRIAGETREGGV